MAQLNTNKLYITKLHKGYLVMISEDGFLKSTDQAYACSAWKEVVELLALLLGVDQEP